MASGLERPPLAGCPACWPPAGLGRASPRLCEPVSKRNLSRRILLVLFLRRTLTSAPARPQATGGGDSPLRNGGCFRQEGLKSAPKTLRATRLQGRVRGLARSQRGHRRVWCCLYMFAHEVRVFLFILGPSVVGTYCGRAAITWAPLKLPCIPRPAQLCAQCRSGAEQDGPGGSGRVPAC